MLYLTAVSTGFRARELGSLTRDSFGFEARPATVTLAARSSKRRKNDTQPLQESVVILLDTYLGQSPRPDLIWPGTWVQKGAAMLRRDLKAAGLPYRDDAGRVLDFHRLRGTFATNLVRAGVSPAKAQELMRHSDVNLTMRLYKKLEVEELAAEVERLPEVSVALQVALGPTTPDQLHALSTVPGVQRSSQDDNTPDESKGEHSQRVMSDSDRAQKRATDETRTHDLRFTKASLCRLSYGG